MLRQVLISNAITYGSGSYGMGYYGGFSEVYISDDWNFSKSINNQTQFTFTIISNFNNLVIVPGLEVILLIDAAIAFKGIISTIDKYETMPGYLYYDITCVTFDKLTQKRRIAQVFTSKTAGYIINWMISNILVDENITAGTIQDGPTFTKVIFNYSSCYNALNKIQTACPGYNWHIDNDKKLHFYLKSTYTSTYTINDSLASVQYSNFNQNDTIDEYRNSQYIEGGESETSQQVNYNPTPAPDGISREFLVKFPISQEPTIELNIGGGGWVAVPSADVGTNYDTGKKWYWSYNSYKITQDQGEAVLTAADAIRVTYYGLRKIFLKYDDNTEINTRIPIDGNSGIYEEIFNNQDIATYADAANYAAGLINKFKDQKTCTLIIEYDKYDFDINMLVKIEKTLFGINSYYLIESISIKQSNPEKIIMTLKLLSGEYVGGWQDYFSSLLQQQSEIKESDVIIIFSGLTESIDWQVETTVEVVEILTPSISLYPSTSLYPGTITETQIFNE